MECIEKTTFVHVENFLPVKQTRQNAELSKAVCYHSDAGYVSFVIYMYIMVLISTLTTRMFLPVLFLAAILCSYFQLLQTRD
jgi:hypothetical protein